MKKFLISVIILLVLVIGAEVGFLVYRDYAADNREPTTVPTTVATEATTEAPTQVTTVPTTAVTEAPTTIPTTVATEAPTETTAAPTEAPTDAPTEATTEAPTEAPTEAATEAPTEAATEPSDGSTTYVLSFAGSCTLGTTLSDAKNSASFHSIVGDDYGYPFQNVLEHFRKDDFTMVNLEGVLADSGDPIAKNYTFLGPAAYAKILTEGSVEAVSLSNDHTGDFGTEGYKATKTSLETEGISYVEKDSSLLYVTERGLKVGVYAVNFRLSSWDMQQEIRKLKNNGAEVIVVYFNWGEEMAYEPSLTQINYGHAAIDAGADIVIGTNPHVLQSIEYYKYGIICYSLGNFSYGGTKWPKDTDTAFVQLEVIRHKNGKISIGELFIVPCSMTSSTSQNNYQPTPLESSNWQYKQVLRKLSEPLWVNETTGVTAPSSGATTPTTAPTETPAEPTESFSPDVPDIDDPQA